MTKKLILTLAAITLIVGTGVLGLTGLKNVYADDETKTGFPPMIQDLVERFNLNEDEVTQFVEEKRTERQQERKTELEEKLNQAVSDGKLTQEQKDTLFSMMEENMQNRHQNREEIHNWAQENGVDLRELGLGRKGSGMGIGAGESIPGGRGFKGDCLFDE